MTLCCTCRTDDLCGHDRPHEPRYLPELDEVPPPTWTAVAVSWVVALPFQMIATAWYPYNRIRAWLARRRARR